MLKIMTWLWKQNPDPHGYDAEKVNVWAAMLRRNITIPHSLACVTDMPEGIDPSVEIIPLPREFSDVRCSGWSEKKGAPQCYRRLTMFAPDAAQRFGAERFVSMDLDVVVCGNIDRILRVDTPLKFYRGTSAKRPYNGSMMHITAGCRPDVFTKFTPEGAEKSRAKFIGSDQAWISYVLGWSEETWSEKDGVYFYTLGFDRKFSRRGQLCPPANTKILFFPGKPKPWEMLEHEWLRERWHAGNPYPKPKSRRVSAPAPVPERAQNGRGKSGRYALPRPAPVPPTTSAPAKPERAEVWSFKGPKGWGEQFWAAARQAGVHARMFTESKVVPAGARAWVRLDQQDEWRDRTRGMVEALHAKGVVTLPTLREARWYDDKLAQLDVLRPWMPDTMVVTSLDEALRLVRSCPSFPLVSKSHEGSASANVRLLANAEEAEAEARKVFGEGLVLRYGRRQRGYVYWQRFVPDQRCDYRVIVAGSLVYGLIRDIRSGDFRASGSGKFMPMLMQSHEERAAAKLAIEISDSIETQWMAYDVVFDGGNPKVLEMSSSWAARGYERCVMFDRTLKPTRGDPMREAVKILMTLPVIEAE